MSETTNSGNSDTNSKRRKLSTYEIALFLQQDEEENFDDSDKDPDFMEMDARSDSSDSSDDQDMVIRANKRPASVPETRVYMDPPVERGDADTDKDSDDSDEPTGLISHLPRRLLGEHAEKRERRRTPLNRERLENDSDEEDDLAVPEDPRNWRKINPRLVGSRVPCFQKVDMNAKDREELEGLTTALGYYQLFQPDSFVDQVVHQSQLYATQKNISQAQTIMNLMNYRCMEAMLLHGGYAPVPRRRMLWEDKPD